MGARLVRLIPEDKLQSAYEALKNIGNYQAYENEQYELLYSCKEHKVPLASFEHGKTDKEVEDGIKSRMKELALKDAKGLYKALVKDQSYTAISGLHPEVDLKRFVNAANIDMKDLDPGKTEERIEDDINKAVSRYRLSSAKALYAELPVTMSKTPDKIPEVRRMIAYYREMEKFGIEELDSSVPKSEIEKKLHQADLAHLRYEYGKLKDRSAKGTYSFWGVEQINGWIKEYGAQLSDLDPKASVDEIKKELRKPGVLMAKNALMELPLGIPMMHRSNLEKIHKSLEEGSTPQDIAPNMTPEEFANLLERYEYKTAGVARLDKTDNMLLVSGQSFITPANSILRHTKVEIRDLSEPRYIDWAGDDAYIKAIKTSVTNAYKDVSADPQVKELLQKKEWTRHDREAWEERLVQATKKAIEPFELLSKYRTTPDPKFDKKVTTDAAGKDIQMECSMNKQTMSSEHDCSDMSIDYAIVIQRLENAMLDKGEGYKARSNYYHASGMKVAHSSGGHAFVISEKTASIIESTNGSYLPNLSNEYTFQHFVAGYPLHTEGGVYFSSFAIGTTGIFEMAAQRLEAIRRDNIEALNMLTDTSSLYDRKPSEMIAKLQVFSAEKEDLRTKPEEGFKNNVDELKKIEVAVRDDMRTDASVNMEELEKIKQSFGEKKVSYVNLPGERDAIAYKGVIIPVTFDKSVTETPFK